MHLESLQAYKARFASPFCQNLTMVPRVPRRAGLRLLLYNQHGITQVYLYTGICPVECESQLRKEKYVYVVHVNQESVGCVWASAGVWIRPFAVETLAGGFFTVHFFVMLVLTRLNLEEKKERSK